MSALLLTLKLPSLDEQIEEIMESFNFVLVHRVMELSGMTWDGVDEVTGASAFMPTPYDLRLVADRMLREVAGREGNNSLRIGGFVVTKRHGHLNLYFITKQEENPSHA